MAQDQVSAEPSLHRFTSQADQFGASEYSPQRSLSTGSASEPDLLLALTIDVEPVQDQEGRRACRRKSMPLYSGGLPALNFAKFIKPKIPLFRRLSSHPLDDNTLFKRAIEQHHQLQQKPQHGVPAAPLTEDHYSAIKQQKETIYKLTQGRKHAKNYFERFYFMANQCFIYDEMLTLCALCTHHKCDIAGHERCRCIDPCLCDSLCTLRKCNRSNGVGLPRSHIFPRTLLESYEKIHCKGQTNYIYDPSTKKIKGTGQLAFPLFCNKCEQLACGEEKILNSVYMQLMVVSADDHPTVEKALSHELRHILAVLLFRGILMGVNFWEELLRIPYQDFFDVFSKLHNYCSSDCRKSEHEEQSFADNIHLFMLPNAKFNPQNEHPTYILDFQLRNPQFTTVIEVGKSYCFYMKFDCFHCVVPIVDNGDLGFLKNAGSCFAEHNYNEDNHSYMFLDHRDAINHFPRELLHYNLAQTEQLLNRFLHVPKHINSQPYCVIKWALLWPEVNSETQPPTQESGGSKIPIKASVRGIKGLQEKARNHSTDAGRSKIT